MATEWKFSQVFGERAPTEHVEDADIISAIEFESEGEYLATGDHGGRVVIFERTGGKDTWSRKALENMDVSATMYPKYVYKTEFQSHEPEFDCLKSLEIEEKINKLKWCTAHNNSLFILSTNDKTIKLWEVLEHKVKKVKEVVQIDPSSGVMAENAQSAKTGKSETSVPNGHHFEWINKKSNNNFLTSQENPNMAFNVGDGISSRCRRVFAHAHDFHINSISNNSDGETFISADDLRINLWNMEISDQCFNIIDMKPLAMKDLLEVITSAEFHPSYCNLLAYSSSGGIIRLVDMRRPTLCDQNARILQDRETHGSRSFFTEIVTSISDLKFSKDGRHILSRDYMNLKLWDLHMESSPIATFKIHEYLRPRLSELYNSDSIFDKFDCCLSRDGRHFATGSYSNTFKIFSCDDGLDEGIALEASRNPNRISQIHHGAPKPARLFSSLARLHHRRGNNNKNHNSDTCSNGIPCDLTSKLKHLAWHPTSNLIACAAANTLFMYHA